MKNLKKGKQCTCMLLFQLWWLPSLYQTEKEQDIHLEARVWLSGARHLGHKKSKGYKTSRTYDLSAIYVQGKCFLIDKGIGNVFLFNVGSRRKPPPGMGGTAYFHWSPRQVSLTPQHARKRHLMLFSASLKFCLSDKCAASLGKPHDAEQLPMWQNFQSAPHNQYIVKWKVTHFWKSPG